jgi:hypothetical protein
MKTIVLLQEHSYTDPHKNPWQIIPQSQLIETATGMAYGRDQERRVRRTGTSGSGSYADRPKHS